MVNVLANSDSDVQLVANALQKFDDAHPSSDCSVYRYNSASIRVRIIDASFTQKDKGERHDYAMTYLSGLPESTLCQISILLCLAPGETSLMDLEFSDPKPSTL